MSGDIKLNEDVYASRGYSLKQMRVRVTATTTTLLLRDGKETMQQIPIDDIRSIYVGVGTVKLKLTKGSISFMYKPARESLNKSALFGLAGYAYSYRQAPEKTKLWLSFAKQHGIKRKLW